MTDFNYKKYSLENLENWLHDSMSSGEATPQEIYDLIVSVVKDNYYTYKQKASEAYELLTLLNGNGNDHISPYGSYINSAYGDDIFVFNTKDEIKSCGAGDTSEYCKKSWNSFWEEDVIKEDKVTKWVLPVQLDGLTGDCYINLPDDLLELAGLKEGDTVKWIDNKNGTYTMVKTTEPLGMDEC